jgi:hypothetical protein
MNQDQVKETLLSIREAAQDFTVILSGKKSGRVNGLYKPESREIILHNKNFSNDNELMYTAIHEYAHHIQFSGAGAPTSARTHTTAFWNLFHGLLFEAEEAGAYKNPFEGIAEFRALTAEIKDRFITVNGSLMKELGGLLMKAHELCEKHGTSFTDYLDRVLALPRAGAHAIMKAKSYDLDPRVGFENMRTLAGIRDDGQRAAAQKSLVSGKSPDMVKAGLTAGKKPPDARAALEAERVRLQNTIKRLRSRLSEVEKRLDQMEG